MNIPQKRPAVTLTDYLFNKASAGRIPLSGGFELSPECNFSCRMCYVRKTSAQLHESARGLLLPEQWKALARQARDAGMLYALLTGGEPLLWEGFWELYEDMADMGILVSVNTNGSLLDAEAVRRLRRRPPRRMNVTLYGAGDETYRRLCGVEQMFSRVDEGIRLLKEAGIGVKLNCSLTPDNARDLEAIAAYAKELALPLSATSYMFPPIRRAPEMVGRNARFTPEEAAQYRLRTAKLQMTPAQYRAWLERICRGQGDPPGLEEGCIDPADGKIRCRAGKASFWITWDGYLTPCGMMPEPKVDLTGVDFAGGWKILTEQADRMRLSGVCDGCESREICHPCAAMALAETGTAEGIPTYLCRMTKAMQHTARKELEYCV